MGVALLRRVKAAEDADDGDNFRLRKCGINLVHLGVHLIVGVVFGGVILRGSRRGIAHGRRRRALADRIARVLLADGRADIRCGGDDQASGVAVVVVVTRGHVEPEGFREGGEGVGGCRWGCRHSCAGTRGVGDVVGDGRGDLEEARGCVGGGHRCGPRGRSETSHITFRRGI